jgi:hypothetical protein
MMLWLLLVLLINSLCIANSPILRLYRKTEYSIIVGLLNWVFMIGGMLLLLKVLPPKPVFVFTYLIGQLTPLLITGYIFTNLLRKDPDA